MYHFVLWCIFRDFAVTLSFPDCYRWFSHIFNDTLRSVPSTIKKNALHLFFFNRRVVLMKVTCRFGESDVSFCLNE